MKGTYDVRLDTPKSFYRGPLTVDVKGDVFVARLEAGDLGEIMVTGTVDGKEFSGEGTAQTEKLGGVAYKLTGNVWGSSIDAKIEYEGGVCDLMGTRTSAQAGDFGEGSGMWAGRWSDGY